MTAMEKISSVDRKKAIHDTSPHLNGTTATMAATLGFLEARSNPQTHRHSRKRSSELVGRVPSRPLLRISYGRAK